MTLYTLHGENMKHRLCLPMYPIDVFSKMLGPVIKVYFYAGCIHLSRSLFLYILNTAAVADPLMAAVVEIRLGLGSGGYFFYLL